MAEVGIFLRRNFQYFKFQLYDEQYKGSGIVTPVFAKKLVTIEH